MAWKTTAHISHDRHLWIPDETETSNLILSKEEEHLSRPIHVPIMSCFSWWHKLSISRFHAEIMNHQFIIVRTVSTERYYF